jgi:hypothetical protein
MPAQWAPAWLQPAVADAALQSPAAQAPPMPQLPLTRLAWRSRLWAVALPVEERESVRSLGRTQPYKHRNHPQGPLTPDVEPAFSYRVTTGDDRSRRVTTGTTGTLARALRTRALAPKPASIEDLAFEPVHVLPSGFRRRQIPSADLTSMYLSTGSSGMDAHALLRRQR